MRSISSLPRKLSQGRPLHFPRVVQSQAPQTRVQRLLLLAMVIHENLGA